MWDHLRSLHGYEIRMCLHFGAFYCLQFWCWTKWGRHHWMRATLILFGRWVMTESLMISPFHENKKTDHFQWRCCSPLLIRYYNDNILLPVSVGKMCVSWFFFRCSSGNFHLSKTMLRKNPLNRTDLKWFALNKWHGRWLTSIRLAEDDWVNEKFERNDEIND